MPRMELLIGPIASGKSTYARQRAAEGALVLNDDAFTTAVHGGNYVYEAELKPLLAALDSATISAAASLGRDVIVDTGCRKRARRLWYAGLGRTLGFTVVAKCFEWQSAATHARRRFEHDARGYDFERWLVVAERHEREFEPVAPWEGLI